MKEIELALRTPKYLKRLKKYVSRQQTKDCINEMYDILNKNRKEILILLEKTENINCRLREIENLQEYLINMKLNKMVDELIVDINQNEVIKNYIMKDFGL